MQATRIIHAYKQAPWRVQRQWISAFLLILIGAGMVAALYLDVTARSTLAGRDIQKLRSDIITIEQSNADLETQLADLTSTAAMQQRAIAFGYRPVKPGEIDYVIVPGYVEPKPQILSETESPVPHTFALPMEYSQSLLEWLDNRLMSGGAQ